MFEVDPRIGAAGAATRAGIAAASNGRLAGHFEQKYEEWRAYAKRLEKEIDDLKLALAVAQATEDADDALLAEWKALYPQAPLRQVVGQLKDGRPKTKGITIWQNAFDASLRKKGITNPLAHRIS